MAIDQRMHAGKIWPYLVETASSKTKLTYAELAPRVGIFPKKLVAPLDVIAKHCKRNVWPPLAAVIVATDTGEPVPEVLDGDDAAAAFRKVYEFDWSKVRNPFELFTSTK